MGRIREARRVAAAGIGLLLVAGLVWDGNASAASTAVSIQNFAFSPASVSVSTGDTVNWTNSQAGIMHTVTADDGSFNSGLLATGQMFAMTFTRAGSFAYHCMVHPTMHGSVTVMAPVMATAAPPAATVVAQPSPAASPSSPPPPPPPPPPAARPTTAAAPTTVAAATTAPRPPTAVATGAAVASPVGQRPAQPPVQKPVAPLSQAPRPAARPAPARALPSTGSGALAGAPGIPAAALTLAAGACALAALGLFGYRRSRSRR